MNDFVKERDTAFIEAVVNDNWKPFLSYCKKYDVPMPETREVMKAGVYKAVQHCTNIPEEVKEKAFSKCLELGFSPVMCFDREVEG